MKYFRSVTIGKPVMMGRKTYASIGKPLPGRTNIVVTRDAEFAAPGILVAPGIEAALSAARGDALRRGADEIAVIGGSRNLRADHAAGRPARDDAGACRAGRRHDISLRSTRKSGARPRASDHAAGPTMRAFGFYLSCQRDVRASARDAVSARCKRQGLPYNPPEQRAPCAGRDGRDIDAVE